MSRYRGNGDRCPQCGLVYRNLRTGVTYKQVRSWLWSHSHDTKAWRYKRRHGVLGRWHQYKLELWRQHLEGCELYARESAA